MKKNLIKYFLLFLTSLPVFSQGDNPLTGHWEGQIDFSGTKLDIITEFKSDKDSMRGTIEIPQQSSKQHELIHVRSKNGKVYFELPAGGGLAIFSGKMLGDSVYGDFTQSGYTGNFYLTRGEKEVPPPISDEITEYKQEEVTFVNGENTFAGTLTIPKLPGKHPAVVLITGSGPQNRDEEIVGFKPFKIIADYLTKNGVAVLRYDDRGVGGSTGKTVNESTTDDFSGDVIEAVKFLKTREDINPDQIGLMGHSEGGIIAPLAASKYNGIAFIVLMAGTGVKGIDIIKEQSKLIMQADNSTEVEIDGYERMLDYVYEASTTGEGWGDLKKKFKESMEEAYDHMTDKEKKSIPDKDAYIKSMTESTLAQFKSVWMKYFLSYDPAIALQKVSCPVLMLFGDKDLQVPPKQNEKPMAEALKKGGNKDYTVKKFPDANHLFQKAKTGNPAEYAALPKEFVPGFLEAVAEWITARVSVVK